MLKRIHRGWNRLLARLRLALAQGARQSEPNFFPIGIVGVVGFPAYYFIWHDWFPQPYENLGLRLIGAGIFLPYLFLPRWPKHWRPLLGVYWFFTMLYALPFFFTFMLLKNGMSDVWHTSTMAALILLVLLVQEWLLLSLLFATGTTLAWLAHIATGGQITVPADYLAQLPIYLFVMVTGSIVNYKAALVSQERLDAMFAVSRNIAHELRTPLLGIRSGVGGLRRYLPHLLEAYELAREKGLCVPPMRQGHRRALKSVLDRIENETNYSNTIIDMLLINAGRHQLDASEYTITHISECVAIALKRYPFRSQTERERVRWRPGEDFVFQGSPLLMIHVIFNLLRNALHFIAEAGHGEIVIWTECNGTDGILHVLDTGTGIRPEVLPYIYNRFYSSRTMDQGAGIGLAFCKMVMGSFGGSIHCKTEYGKYTEFMLTFPGVSHHG
ncbi:MAG: HAMP domain-containing histidine kinase [Nitrococcus mobilis]|nr:HAMP domain-containing histidine kinase [Nitrococcus mobilis]